MGSNYINRSHSDRPFGFVDRWSTCWVAVRGNFGLGFFVSLFVYFFVVSLLILDFFLVVFLYFYFGGVEYRGFLVYLVQELLVQY